MAIRFRIPAHAVERVAHAYSPLLEAVLSLHVVVEPKHHPLQHPWVRRTQALPAALKRDIAAFSFAYRRQLPDLLAPSTDHELRSFEDELASLRALDADTVALEFTRPLYDTEGTRDTALLERPEVQRHIVATPASSARAPTWRGSSSRIRFVSATSSPTSSSATGRRRLPRRGPASSPCLPAPSLRPAAGSPRTGYTRCSAASRCSCGSTRNGRSSASTSRTGTPWRSPSNGGSSSCRAPTSGRTRARQLRRALAPERGLRRAVRDGGGAAAAALRRG